MAQTRTVGEIDDINYCQYLRKYINANLNTTAIPPTPGWIIDNDHSDEFNGTELNELKWHTWDYFYHPNNKQTAYLKENVQINNGFLIISLSYNPNGITCSSYDSYPDTSFHYFSGSVVSNDLIQYGYLETKCYFPQNYNYRPCFWTTGRKNSVSQYDEIDIFERLKDLPLGNRQLLQNCYHNDGYPDYSFCTQRITFSEPFTGMVSTFGVEILPHEIVFYVNGYVTSHLRFDSELKNEWNTFTCNDIDEMIPMHVILEMMVTVDGLSAGSYPMPLENCLYDYFRYYRLERGNQDTFHPSVFIPSGESTKVYPHVVLGGSGCNANISTATAVWAEQDIIFDKGFQLEAGTAFSARVISVPDPEHSSLYIQNNNKNQ